MRGSGAILVGLLVLASAWGGCVMVAEEKQTTQQGTSLTKVTVRHATCSSSEQTTTLVDWSPPELLLDAARHVFEVPANVTMMHLRAGTPFAGAGEWQVAVEREGDVLMQVGRAGAWLPGVQANLHGNNGATIATPGTGPAEVVVSTEGFLEGLQVTLTARHCA